MISYIYERDFVNLYYIFTSNSYHLSCPRFLLFLLIENDNIERYCMN